MSRRVNVGLIGTGRIGKVHAATVAYRLPEAELTTVTDIDAESARALGQRCAVPRVAASAEELIADPAIDAVLICSSTNTHADLIVKAAQAGKHIFCEKPIDHTLDKFDRALNAV